MLPVRQITNPYQSSKSMRQFGMWLGLILVVIGALLTFTIVLAIIGIPFALIGLLFIFINIKKINVQCSKCNAVVTLRETDKKITCSNCNTTEIVEWV